MSLAIGVLLTENSEGILQKKVYDTIIYLCDQDVLDIFCVSQQF